MSEIRTIRERYLSSLLLRGVGNECVCSYRFELERFIRWIERKHQVFRPADLTSAIIVAWQIDLSQQRRRDNGMMLRPMTVHTSLRTLRVFVRWLAKEGLVSQSLAKEFPLLRRPPMPYKSSLAHAQVRKALRAISSNDACGTALRALAEFVYSTGTRPCELCRMNIGDVDFENAEARLHGKGGKDRVVRVGRKALRYLENYLRGIRSLWLRVPDEPAFWVNQCGQRISRARIRATWHRVMNRSPITAGITAYSLRRACATELVRGGADLWAVKELLGHEYLDTLIHYVRTDLADLKKMHAKYHPRDQGMDDATRL